MKKTPWVFTLLLFISVFALSACVPYSFSTPMQIHINAGDKVEHAVIAVDGDGRSHIAGIVADRVVYYRTLHGEPLQKFTMALGGTGPNWKQYNPDIAALNNGTSFVTWVEQRGTTDKFACYLTIPITPPIGGFDKTCHTLDSTDPTAGHVWVVARENTAYAVYDRPYTDGRTSELWYRKLSAWPTYAGRVHWFTERYETAKIYSLDMGIDDDGFLHVGYHYNWTTGGPPPFAERLEIRSNRSINPDGQMNQIWVINTQSGTDEDVPVSLSFFNDGGFQNVALASVEHEGTLDCIFISFCTAAGCVNKGDHAVSLPSSWDTKSVIKDVEILGVGNYLYLGFIGDDDTAPTGAEQVYYTWDPFAMPVSLLQPSAGSATFKYDLEMTRVNARPGSSATHFPMMAWGESNMLLNEFFVYEGLTPKVKIYETNCITNLPIGEIASNDVYFSGVWDDCYNTIFSTQAYITDLPLVVK